MRDLRPLGFLGLLALSHPAYAYIDPNAGNLLWQVIGPVFLAVAMGWSYLVNKVRAAYRKLRPGNKTASPD